MNTTNLGSGRKAQFLNMAEDGLKIRSAVYKNKKKYNRKEKYKKGYDH